MQEHDASDETLLQRARSGASRVAQHLSRNRSASVPLKTGDRGRDLETAVDEAIRALEELGRKLSKEPRS